MDSISKSPNHQQVCWSVTDATREPVPAIDAKKEDRSREAEAERKLIHHPGFNPKDETCSPHPIMTDKSFIMHMEFFNDALVKAVVNIVDRWWMDTDANFPARMPLEAPVEAALQWIDQQTRNQTFPELKDHLGNWRPDFLITGNDNAMGPGFQICEINSRTPDNVLLRSAHRHRRMRQLIGASSGLQPAGDPDDWEASLLRLFHTHLPVHILRGRDEFGRQELVQMMELRTGICPRIVHVDELELKPDESSGTGYSLYYQGEGVSEKIHQVVSTLFPDEFGLLPQGMLRQLATVAVNDLRISLLVNDERFLGIILQELDTLVTKHGILTPGQANALQQGLVPTLLPGSPELKRWMERNNKGETSKDNYILKAARQSRGSGHLLGADLSPQEWASIMRDMQDPSIRPGATSYVLQPFVPQVRLDLISTEDEECHGSLMVGCYYTVNGRFLGLGPWRSSTGKICNVYSGSGCVVLYPVTQVDLDN
ncbi:uncharacterized protein P174DRAFT_386359 [Aspergillus novofumigatus IBT 16806]|uniref:Uncharacterized protein n=1 Tax=Aspergillus novofumigatus (strain IBT 16806) TaxID=1392255 RepID=A0A2I1CBV8_ASPN1|nr:uncharacterized protein P174DRAFT_386359 [Aspergillus novofumigatus IBT 16806]PKX95110.1 hypothetical protein P174DRAFT_386359 [Aspergillus novofumigatus IBT 16806]